jgi:hypothetical protein
MSLGHHTVTAAASTSDDTDGIPCVATDEVSDLMIVGDGVSSTVRLHSTTTKRSTSSPAQSWYDWTSGKRDGVVKRPREVVDDGELELF